MLTTCTCLRVGALLKCCFAHFGAVLDRNARRSSCCVSQRQNFGSFRYSTHAFLLPAQPLFSDLLQFSIQLPIPLILNLLKTTGPKLRPPRASRLPRRPSALCSPCLRLHPARAPMSRAAAPVRILLHSFTRKTTTKLLPLWCVRPAQKRNCLLDCYRSFIPSAHNSF